MTDNDRAQMLDLLREAIASEVIRHRWPVAKALWGLAVAIALGSFWVGVNLTGLLDRWKATWMIEYSDTVQHWNPSLNVPDAREALTGTAYTKPLRAKWTAEDKGTP